MTCPLSLAALFSSWELPSVSCSCSTTCCCLERKEEERNCYCYWVENHLVVSTWEARDFLKRVPIAVASFAVTWNDDKKEGSIVERRIVKSFFCFPMHCTSYLPHSVPQASFSSTVHEMLSSSELCGCYASADGLLAGRNIKMPFDIFRVIFRLVTSQYTDTAPWRRMVTSLRKFWKNSTQRTAAAQDWQQR